MANIDAVGRIRCTERLERFGQRHLLGFWDDATEDARRSLLEQIEQVDFQLLSDLHARPRELDDRCDLAARAEPPDAIRLAEPTPRFSRGEARQRGEAELREGRVGVILVAGGQATRLRTTSPKGLYPIGPVSERTLFQILVDRVRAIRQRFGASIPLFIMTSPATDAETQAYFAAHEWLGLPPDDVRLFCQGVMPAVDAESGKLLLATRHSLALSPDGHGGLVRAIEKHGGLDFAIDRHIRSLYYAQVDNPLAPLADPELLGYHLLGGSELTTCVVAKRDPLQKVGNVVRVDGKTRIIEYSELPEPLARATQLDGSPKLWAGNIAIHVFDVQFLRRMARDDDALPFHAARKVVPFVNAEGEQVSPSLPNAFKYERFIFDLLPMARQALVVETNPAESFAPVKNAEGEREDTPAHARAAMVSLHRRWLEQAGVQVREGVPVEINPCFALEPEELATKVAPGTVIERPTYFV